MQFIRINSFLSILLCLTSLSFSQANIKFVTFNSSHGLSQNAVHCLYQDKQGLLWIGTQDGLNSFDGKNFTTYRYNPNDTTTLSDQFILAIEEDDNYLWIETRSGINRLNKQTGKCQRFYATVAEKNGLPRTIASIGKNKQGQLLVPHQKQPIYLDKSITPNYLPKQFATHKLPIIDANNNLWSINDKGFLQTITANFNNPSTITTFATIPSYNKVLPYKLKENNFTKCIYIFNSVNSEIKIYNRTTNTFSSMAFANNVTVNDVLFVNDSTTWYATSKGIFIQHRNNIPSLLSNTSLPAGTVLCLYKDAQQNIWVGTANGGFAFYNPKFTNYSLTSTPKANDAVYGYAEATNVSYFAASSGLYFKKENSNQLIPHPKFINKKIGAVCTDKNNNVWLAVSGQSIYQLRSDGKILQQFTSNTESLHTSAVLYLYCSNKNEIIACTETGYFVFNQTTKTWLSFYKSNLKKSEHGSYMLHGFQDAANQHWFSTQKGIIVTNENFVFKEFISAANTTTPITKSIITGVTQDKNNIIWIATLSSGLYKYQNKKLTHFTTNNGLTSNVLYGVVVDTQNNIWCATTAGLEILQQHQNQFYLFNEKDGLPNIAFTIGSLQAKKNIIHVGSSQGLITINTTNLSFKQPIAKAQIASIKLNGTNINLSNTLLQIEPSAKTVGFTFSLQQALQPKNIIYQYKLVGVDDDWNTLPTNVNDITYTTLPYKKLTLVVRAAYNKILLNNAPVYEYNFLVKTPFTQTWWFKTLLALLLAVLIFFIYKRWQRNKQQKLVAQQKIQQELKQERERISRDLHDNIGAYTSALISGIGRLDTTNNKEEVNNLHDYATNMMGYLRETIWVLNNEKLTIEAFTDRFKNYAQRMVKNYKNLQLKFDIAIAMQQQTLTPAESLNLFRILQEALQNSCKHANATIITFGYNYNTKHCFYIKDNGMGFTPQQQENHYGLQNMQARAAEIGFTLVIESREAGTLVSINQNE